MPTTTNFGWTTPADTDLVKDGAAAMRTLGNSIDASFVDLKGGTTGQILSKASNTDLDYTWINNDQGDITGVVAGTGLSGGGTSGSVTLTNTVATAFDAAGDLVYGTGADTFTKLGLGTAGQVLTVNSGATAPEWKTPAGAKNYSLIGTGTLTGAGTITVSGLSNLDSIYVVIQNASSANASSVIRLRINADSGANYDYSYGQLNAASTYAANTVFDSATSGSISEVDLGQMSTNAGSVVNGYAVIQGGATSGQKMILYSTGGTASSGNSQKFTTGIARWDNSATITSISLLSSTGNFDNGSFLVYGAS